MRTTDFGVSTDLRIRVKSGVSQGQLSMVVAPHVDRFAWTIGLEKNSMLKISYIFIDPRHMPFMVSDDMVWSPVCRLCLLRDVGGVPLTRATDSESNSHPF